MQLLAQGLVGGARLGQGGVILLDRFTVRQRAEQRLAPFRPALIFVFGGGPVALAFGAAGAGGGGIALPLAEGSSGLLGGGSFGFGPLQGVLGCLVVRFGSLPGGLNRRRPRQFGSDFGLLLGELRAAGRGFGFAFAGARGRRLPATELQDSGEQLLPFPRRADREGVSAALDQESGMDEGFIIQAEQLPQALVGGREVGGADIAVFALRQLIEAQAAARTGAALPAPQDAVRRAVLLEIQLDVHL